MSLETHFTIEVKHIEQQLYLISDRVFMVDGKRN
jgi:hypothetical protein